MYCVFSDQPGTSSENDNNLPTKRKSKSKRDKEESPDLNPDPPQGKYLLN